MSEAAVSAHTPPVVLTPDPQTMRHTMGIFATGVTIVTGADDAGPTGFACQSFASVSLAPPLVLFCADHRGRAWPRIREAGHFCVNVLGDDQADLCRRFGSAAGTKFDGLPWTASPWGTPLLPDVLCRVHAAVEAVHASGDHDVVIGRVSGLETPRRASPLVFYKGRFGIEDDSAHALPDLFGWNDVWS
ncbi:flavin reductase family protein [Prauserella halophila]|uniref:Flavin reductase family protein n=1 Tax=Prauserella halophila TaxID=185641 RepID=A0ABN1VYD2_9PSEU|nr:flavin reductase family protein [Prauserella halophila]MCP2237419.1 NADH-FMN oxidoreductase RutF, flavin reductase (DIM6/NTAB) family [Prauserella halophila]